MSSTRLHNNRPLVSTRCLTCIIRTRNKPFATHESADGTRLAHVETTQFGNDGAREELGEERDDTEQDRVPPCDAVIQEAQVCPKTRKGEVLEKASQPPHTEITLLEDRSNWTHDIPTEGE
jgi:hypothetical protein